MPFLTFRDAHQFSVVLLTRKKGNLGSPKKWKKALPEWHVLGVFKFVLKNPTMLMALANYLSLPFTPTYLIQIARPCHLKPKT